MNAHVRNCVGSISSNIVITFCDSNVMIEEHAMLNRKKGKIFRTKKQGMPITPTYPNGNLQLKL